MNIKNCLWILPFISFAGGYLMMYKIMYIPETITPHLVGKQVHTVLAQLTQHNLNIRLIEQKEEPNMPEGIILNQTPTAGTAMRQNQPVFIVTTKKPVVIRTPQCIGISIDTLHSELQTQGIHPRVYQVPHPYPEKICFAQSPQHNEPLENNKLTLYLSSGNNKPIIWPNFTNMSLQEVINFLDNHHIEPHIIRDHHHMHDASNEYYVIDQRPLAGTLITLDENKPLSVQLRITNKFNYYE